MIEVTMDQSGKVEIPEVIRQCLRLTPGSKLEIAIDRLKEIRIHPLPANGESDNQPDSQNEVSGVKEAKLIRKNGVLMVAATQDDEYLKYYLENAVELDREERMRKLMGEITL